MTGPFQGTARSSQAAKSLVALHSSALCQPRPAPSFRHNALHSCQRPLLSRARLHYCLFREVLDKVKRAMVAKRCVYLDDSNFRACARSYDGWASKRSEVSSCCVERGFHIYAWFNMHRLQPRRSRAFDAVEPIVKEECLLRRDAQSFDGALIQLRIGFDQVLLSSDHDNAEKKPHPTRASIIAPVMTPNLKRGLRLAGCASSVSSHFASAVKSVPSTAASSAARSRSKATARQICLGADVADDGCVRQWMSEAALNQLINGQAQALGPVRH